MYLAASELGLELVAYQANAGLPSCPLRVEPVVCLERLSIRGKTLVGPQFLHEA